MHILFQGIAQKFWEDGVFEELGKKVRESLFVNAKSSFLAKLWLTQPGESTTLKYFKA